MQLARGFLQAALIVAVFALLWSPLIGLPFLPQNPAMLESSLWVNRHLLAIEVICVAVAAAALLAALTLGDPRDRKRPLVYMALGVALCAVASRGDMYEAIFHPLGAPSFDSVADAKLDAHERVMTVALNGTVRAYPIRSVSYHHVVNDVVGGVPLAATYCGLCHTGLVWGREVEGKVLTLHIAGINNQNFLMRDDETGSYWQQVSGKAISGPLKGKSLTLIHSDELTYGLFRTEQPNGQVLRPKPGDEKFYSPVDWERLFSKMPAVVTHPGEGFESKDLMLGLTAFGQSKAYLEKDVLAAKLLRDRLGSTPVMLVVGPDDASVRAFKVPGSDFYRTTEAGPALMMDTATGSKWDFRGCAIEGPAKGQCLEPLDLSRDYWFNWRSYNPGGSIYKAPRT
jgi:hypothetical protein